MSMEQSSQILSSLFKTMQERPSIVKPEIIASQLSDAQKAAQNERIKILFEKFQEKAEMVMSLQNKDFVINNQNKEVINTMILYFAKHSDFLSVKNVLGGEPTFKKGILLLGNVGSGKTILMEIFKRAVSDNISPFMQKKQAFKTVFAKDLPYLIESEGLGAMKQYTDATTKLDGNTVNNVINIEDIGAEKKERHINYGSQYDLIDTLIDTRNRHLTFKGVITHGTTNHNAKQLTELYDERFVSRLYSTFNIIPLGLDKDYIDFRKL